MIKDWISIKNVDELEALGNFNCVRNLIKNDLSELNDNEQLKGEGIKVLHITSNSKKGLVEKIYFLNKFIKVNLEILGSNISQREEKYENEENKFFVNENAQYIYYLTCLSGELRLEKLEAEEAFFEDEVLAKHWYRKLVKLIHSDKFRDNKFKDESSKAIYELKAIYEDMKNCD